MGDFISFPSLMNMGWGGINLEKLNIVFIATANALAAIIISMQAGHQITQFRY